MVTGPPQLLNVISMFDPITSMESLRGSSWPSPTQYV